MKGKARCAMHGGKTPMKTRGNRKHGLYSAHLTPEEQDQWDGIQIGAVDDELRMLRIYLARCVALDAQISNAPSTVELSEVRRSVRPEGDAVDTISRKPDVFGRMNWIVGRIANLEKVRLEMLAAAAERGEGVDDKARDLIQTIRAIEQVEQVVQDTGDEDEDDQGV